MLISPPILIGHLGDGGSSEEAKLIEFPNDEKIVDLSTAVHHMDALSETGNVYYWGKNQVQDHVRIMSGIYLQYTGHTP